MEILAEIPKGMIAFLVVSGIVLGMLMLYSLMAISGRISRGEEREELRRLMHLEDEIEMLDEEEEE